MKKILSYITVCLLAAGAYTGCIDTYEPQGEGEGYLVLGAEFGKTRAEIPASYTVKIGTTKGYTHIFQVTAVKPIPEELRLLSGSYFIEVEAGRVSGPGFDAEPCYYGRETFTITKGAKTNVRVYAYVRNTLFSVGFDETVATQLTGYSATLFPDPANESVTLVFDGNNTGKTASMILAEGQTEVEWEFEADIIAGGTVSKSGRLTGLAPGRHYSLSFKYTSVDKNGTFTLDVTVDETVSETGHDIIISRKPRTLAVPAAGVWATHTTVSGIATQGGTVRFGYRPTGDGEWLYADGVAGTGDGQYSALLTGLVPGTAYEACIEVDGEFSGEPQAFTTAAAPQLPNGNLEEWHDNKVYYPYAQGTEAFWGSGNNVVMGVFPVEMTTPVEGRTPGTKGAQLASQKPAALKDL